MAASLQRIRQVLNDGDKSLAQDLLRTHLSNELFTPDAFYLAARACYGREQAIAFLRMALQIDAHYAPAHEALRLLQYTADEDRRNESRSQGQTQVPDEADYALPSYLQRWGEVKFDPDDDSSESGVPEKREDESIPHFLQGLWDSELAIRSKREAKKANTSANGSILPVNFGLEPEKAVEADITESKASAPSKRKGDKTSVPESAAAETNPQESRTSRKKRSEKVSEPNTMEDMERENALLMEVLGKSTPYVVPTAAPVPSSNFKFSAKRPKKTRATTFREEKRRTRTQIGCLFGILLSLSLSYFVMNVLGLAIAGELSGVFSGIKPVHDIGGTPIAFRADAPLVVPAAAVRTIQSEEPIGDTLLPGYAHEYKFLARRGEEVALMVQFLSPTAKSVQRNVVVTTPDGRDAGAACERGQILTDNSGVTFICNISQTGEWKIRIFGREFESSGAYVVAVERMPPL